MQLIVSTEKEITKAGIKEQVQHVIAKVKEGHRRPLDAFLMAKVLGDYSKQIEAEVKEEALKELSQYGGNTNLNGVDLKQKEARVQYDYSNTDLWRKLQADVEAAIERRKNLEEMLKPLKAPMEIVDEDELTTLNPPIKTSTTTIETKIK